MEVMLSIALTCVLLAGRSTSRKSFASESIEYCVKAAVLRWQEMRCVDIVWAELAEIFDGEDIVMADVRQRLDDAKERVGAIAAEEKKRSLPEPDDELVDEYRKMVDDVLKQFGLLEWR